MYKLYIDKNELFEANIELEGASLDETSARLVMNTDKWNLVFEGNIDANGSVEIPINKLKSIFSDNVKGELQLEVVADDTYFVPWRDNFELLRSKNVTVEVKDKSKDKEIIKESKPKVTVKETKKEKPKKKKGFRVTENVAKDFLREIIVENHNSDNGISFDAVKRITGNYIKENGLDSSARKKLYEIVREWNKKRK